MPILYIDEGAAERQAARVRRLRRERDNAAVDRALGALTRGAAGEENTMPLLIDAVKAYATVGEISDAFRDVFDTYQEPALF